jgi:hypothetical protein
MRAICHLKGAMNAPACVIECGACLRDESSEKNLTSSGPAGRYQPLLSHWRHGSRDLKKEKPTRSPAGTPLMAGASGTSRCGWEDDGSTALQQSETPSVCAREERRLVGPAGRLAHEGLGSYYSLECLSFLNF